MANRLVEVQLPSGRIANVAALAEGGDVAAGRMTEHVSDVVDSVTELTDVVVRALRAKFQQPAPSSVQIEVGIKFAVKSGKLVAFLAEASGEGSLVVTLGWDNDASSRT